MKHLSALSVLLSSLAVLLVSVLMPLRAAAQVKFDVHEYQALVDADSPETIPVGTRITVDNWSKYKRFMPIGMQALYSGKYFWRMGSGPEYTMEVGPSISIPMPKKFAVDTEKYRDQTTLKKIDTGGYTVDNYQAGLPFTKPEEPGLGYKVIYNAWYYFRPFVYTYFSTAYRVDRTLGVYSSTGGVNNWRVSHLSDGDNPNTMPYAGPYFLLIRNPQFTPEQNKYLVSLQMLYSDPAHVQDSYTFLPSLRRALRLSAASRCAPLVGADWVYDDNGGGHYFQVPNFNLKFLGKKKILALMHEKQCTPSKNDCVTVAGSVPGWPKPEVGPWELIDVYVLDATPLPVMGHYCYAHKVLYIACTNAWVTAWWESYDDSDKLWKIDKPSYRPISLGNGETTVIAGIVDAAVWDVQNAHSSISLNSDVRVDSQVDTELQNGKVWGFPSGLDRIMR
jgi:hypothetical protein